MILVKGCATALDGAADHRLDCHRRVASCQFTPRSGAGKVKVGVFVGVCIVGWFSAEDIDPEGSFFQVCGARQPG